MGCLEGNDFVKRGIATSQVRAWNMSRPTEQLSIIKDTFVRNDGGNAKSRGRRKAAAENCLACFCRGIVHDLIATATQAFLLIAPAI